MPRRTGESVTGVPNNKTGLVPWLIEEGARLGFHAEAGYASPEDGAVSDVAWLLNLSQKPVFTFTVEENPMSLVASAMLWAGSSTEPKSWMHICVLTSGATEVLTSLPLPKNVKVYNAESLDSLSRSLDGLTDMMIRLLRDFTEDEPGGSKYEMVKRLSGIAAAWPKDMWSSRLTLKVQTVFGDGLQLFTAEGMEDEEIAAPALKPSRKVVPIDVACGDASFEGALMRLVDTGGDRLLFSTEHRNYPFIIRLSAPVDGGASAIDLWFDVDKSNVPQALRFRELVEGATDSKVVVFAGPSGEVARLTLC